MKATTVATDVLLGKKTVTPLSWLQMLMIDTGGSLRHPRLTSVAAVAAMMLPLLDLWVIGCVPMPVPD